MQTDEIGFIREARAAAAQPLDAGLVAAAAFLDATRSDDETGHIAGELLLNRPGVIAAGSNGAFLYGCILQDETRELERECRPECITGLKLGMEKDRCQNYVYQDSRLIYTPRLEDRSYVAYLFYEGALPASFVPDFELYEAKVTKLVVYQRSSGEQQQTNWIKMGEYERPKPDRDNGSGSLKGKGRVKTPTKGVSQKEEGQWWNRLWLLILVLFIILLALGAAYAFVKISSPSKNSNLPENGEEEHSVDP